MELRSCGMTHFIQTIRGGMVIKVHNVNPQRRPVVTKILKDVYEAEDAKTLGRSPSRLEELVKRENPCFPMADRTSPETKPKTDESASHSEDDGGDNGLDDDITLRQLKKQFVKNRKNILNGEYSKHGTANGKPVEDESDLDEPLINLKRKRSKSSKSKRKQMNPSATSTSTLGITFKSEGDLVSEDSQEAGNELSPFIHVKIEVLDAEQLECQNKTTSDGASSFGHNVLIPSEVASKEFQKIAQHECREPLSCAVKYQECVTNEISYEHLEDVEPILVDVEPVSMLVPWDASVKLGTLELCCEETLDMPPVTIENQKEIRDAHSCTRSLSEDPNSGSHVEDVKNRSGSEIIVPDRATNNIDDFLELGFHQECIDAFENKTEADCPCEVDDSLGSPVENCHPNPHSVILLQTKENLFSIADEEQPSTCSSDSIESNGLNCEVAPKEFQKIVQREYREPVLCAGKYQDVEPILEDVEPVSMLIPWDASVKLETLELCCEETLDMPPLAIENQKEISDAHSCTGSLSGDPNSDIYSINSYHVEDVKQSSGSEILVADMATNNIYGFLELGLHQECIAVSFENKTDELDETLSSPVENCHSNPHSIILLKTKENLISREDTIADEFQPSTRSSDSIESNGLKCEGQIENELLKAEGKHNSTFPITEAESQSSSKNRTPELHQPPERLLSTRKAISPSSQEQLRLAMNAVEIVNAKQNIVSECKGERTENQTRKKASSLGADIQYDKITVNRKRPLQVQRKVITSPRRIIKKLQIPKANNEGPRFSRTLPNLSTGCATIQGCSESAIAFSQRQMHDMESVSVKLMNELKSMKDIVEQKLLFQAYRNVSLKNDADEIKLAIDNAMKVEGVARKWLSVMTRDCNRFCKIMKMTPNSSASSSDTVPRERRKIMFADEAGGKLCHVKYYENGANLSLYDGEK